MSQMFEAFMVIAFGISWPLSIVKSLRSKTAKGKSLIFMLFIFVGYICGIISKIISGRITYVFVFYVLNLVMVGTDIVLYFRNRKFDREQKKNA
ncbi:MAG: hypothetical protein IJJ34_04505 [Clostridia bacterium]|nr:hypothetical protein [Clostridia bacterium]MBR3195349.1 hypothetical protein [Clostridia bacterium]